PASSRFPYTTLFRSEVKDVGGNAWDKNVKHFSNEAVQLLDKFLSNVGQFMFVDLMPGFSDLSTYLWPQQPMHQVDEHELADVGRSEEHTSELQSREN